MEQCGELLNVAALASPYAASDQHARPDPGPLYRRALAIRPQQLSADHPDTVAVLTDLVACYHSQGKDAEAETCLCIPKPVLSSGNDALMVRWWDSLCFTYPQGLKISFGSSNEIPIVFQAISSVFDGYICYSISIAYTPPGFQATRRCCISRMGLLIWSMLKRKRLVSS